MTDDVHETKVASEKDEQSLHEEFNKPENSQTVIGHSDELQRKLGNRQFQIVCLGASIGTALFLSIGGTLHRAGPANLLLGTIVQNIFVAMVNNATAEMNTYMPVAGGFIRMAGHWVDDAIGFMVGWNFFFFQVIVIPFEIVALTLVFSYWSDNIPVVAICFGCVGAYALTNIIAVNIYGESEFWLSGGKAFLTFLLLSFTFITMIGGNPEHDAYGFHNWNNPKPMAEYLSTGTLGQFEGFLNALWFAAFTCVGPEYVSMLAAEAKHPRVYVKLAFKNVYWRQVVFYIGTALAVGILVPYDDPTLVSFFGANATKNPGSASASPYIIAMGNLNIKILPHIVTAFIASTIFSAANTGTYCATRILHGLALEGRAPRVLTKCTKKGIPIYCLGVVLLFPLLSLLALSNTAAEVLNWLVSLATAALMIDYVVICITYLRFYKAMQVQGFDRNQLPYKGWFQPYSTWIALVWVSLVLIFFGYDSFRPTYNITTFFTTYTLVIIAPILYAGWKIYHRTKLVSLADIDLVWEAPVISAYEENETDDPVGFWRGMWNSVSRKEKRHASSA